MQTWYVQTLTAIYLATAEDVETAVAILYREHNLSLNKADLINVVRSHRWTTKVKPNQPKSSLDLHPDVRP